MASKRVAKTAVDWEKFANGLRHEEAVQKLTAWKAQSGQYVSRIAQLPEALPKIDFEKYKSMAPSMSKHIDEFAKQYAATKVDYPSDGGQMAQIDKDEKEYHRNADHVIGAMKAAGDKAREALKLWDSIPPLEQMSNQEWHLYFPGLIPDRKIQPGGVLAPKRDHPWNLYYQGNYRFIVDDSGNYAQHSANEPPHYYYAQAASAEPVNHHKGT